MYCTNCGATISDASRFCSRCGAPIQPASIPTAPSPVKPGIDESMGTHFKVLSWLYLVFGALGAIVGVSVFAFFSSIGYGLSSLHFEGLPFRFPHLASGIGFLIAMVLLIFSVPGLIAGYGLLNFRSWARPLTIVLSVLNLIHPPFGTLLGVYGLWVLLSGRGELYFQEKVAMAQP
jgi:hypothetical protein